MPVQETISVSIDLNIVHSSLLSKSKITLID